MIVLVLASLAAVGFAVVKVGHLLVNGRLTLSSDRLPSGWKMRCCSPASPLPVQTFSLFIGFGRGSAEVCAENGGAARGAVRRHHRDGVSALVRLPVAGRHIGGRGPGVGESRGVHVPRGSGGMCCDAGAHRDPDEGDRWP